MVERVPIPHNGFVLPGDRVLIGVPFDEDGQDVVRYFADDAAADAATDRATERARKLIGAWKDLDWDEMEEALDRIRQKSLPSPCIEA